MISKVSKIAKGFAGKKNKKSKEAKNAGKKPEILVSLAFVGAISVLLLVAGYVVSRISGDYSNKKKWEDYYDYGWS